MQSAAAKIAPGIKLLEEVEGGGVLAAKGDEVVFNLRIFLNKGDEVPLNERQIEAVPDESVTRYGDKPLLDRKLRLGRRQAISGVEKSLEGMRMGGYRRVRVSPHLAYGEKGIPDLIPPNAVLELELWLLDVCPPSESPGHSGAACRVD